MISYSLIIRQGAHIHQTALLCAILRLLKRQTIKIINQYHCHLLLLTMDTYVVAYIVLEQLLVTSILIIRR